MVSPVSNRFLLEWHIQSNGTPALKIDREKGIIYGVKVLGRYSKNVYDPQSTGTEYSRKCMADAIARGLFESVKVKSNHPPDRSKPFAERDVDDAIGVLRSARIESGDDGEPGIYADLHYLKSHHLANPICEDVERSLGIYGLSHNASSDRKSERLDPVTKRLVIESLATVRSVDLVDKPATNRNLWESETVSENKAATTVKQFTLRALLESQKKRLSKNRWSWVRRVLEDDSVMDAGSVDADFDMPDETKNGIEDIDPDEALWAGFSAAIDEVLKKYAAGELDDKQAAKAVATYIKAHANISGDDEPDEADDLEESEDEEAAEDKDKDKKNDEKLESLRLDNDRLKRESACRDLCDSEFFTPTKTQLKTLTLLESDSERRELISALSQSSKDAKVRPRSGYAPNKGQRAGEKTRDVAESEVDVDGAMGILTGWSR